ncbi:MAG: BLUF domain-containing protein [Planctomycetota bacterium]
MTFHRVVCLSQPKAPISSADLLAICRGFPRRNTLSGISGMVLCSGEQFVLMLEGGEQVVEMLVQRIQREAPEAGMAVRLRESAEERAFPALAIEDLYLDEVDPANPAAKEELGDLMIDLFAPPADSDQDTFAAIAQMVSGAAPAPAQTEPIAV